MEINSNGKSRIVRADTVELKLERLEGKECLKLRPLWEEVFYEDSREFTDYYFQEKAIRNHGYALKKEEEAVAMLYLSPYPVMLRGGDGFDCREINYIVGVATREKYRHKGCMDRLLRTALQDMYEQGHPFTFLMPADPEIYRPYQFAYIYDRMEYELRENHIAQGFEMGNSYAVKFMKMEENCSRLVEFAQTYLEENYDVFIRREEAYYYVMEKELQAQKGGIYLIEEKDRIKGYFLYTQEEGKEEIQEAVFNGENESMNCLVVPTGVKTPVIMARIVDVHAMLSLLRAKEKDIVLYIRVLDAILAGNSGVWECILSEGEAKVRKCGHEGRISVELAAASMDRAWVGEAVAASMDRVWVEEVVTVVNISMEELVFWMFGYREAEECFHFEQGVDAAEREEIWYRFHNVRRFERVFINEIV